MTKKEEKKEEGVKVVKEAKEKESEKVKAFRATWELYKIENPEKYAQKVASKEIEKQLEILKAREKEDAEEKVRLSQRSISENPKNPTPQVVLLE